MLLWLRFTHLKMDKKLQGKRNRQAGARFELKVRAALESKGWIIDRWSNNVEFVNPTAKDIEKALEITGSGFAAVRYGKLVKAKPKFVFNPQLKRRIPMGMSSGFPDFVAYKDVEGDIEIGWSPSDGSVSFPLYQIIGVEVKSNGYLDKTEKEKCVWLLKNNIFSKIIIASKSKIRGKIECREFKNA